MKNNGFTLIELLAVIIVISAIFSIVAITVGSIIDDSESSLSEVQKKSIENAAKTYYVEEGMDEDKRCIDLSALIDKGYIKSSEVEDPKTKNTMNGSVRISMNNDKYTYSYNDKSCPVCISVTFPTLGNIPEGAYVYGDEYTCEVGDNYTNTFFVLDSVGNKVSLLMKENFIDSYVPDSLAWCTDGNEDNTTCKNINSTGSNAPEGKDYLGHIKSIFNKSGVEVSFPTALQIANAGGEVFDGTNSVETLLTWEFANVSTSSIPYGYWTATPKASASNNAWGVYAYGYMRDNKASYSNLLGVRPVITLDKSLMD